MREKYLIYIAGYVAGGKTQFSQRLSGELCIPVFNKDRIKAVLGEYIAVNDRAVSKMLSRATFGLMAHTAEQIMQAGGACILESNFIREEAELLRDMAKSHAYHTLAYVFTADMYEIYRRFYARENTPARESANRAFGAPMTFEDFNEMIKPLGDFDAGDETIQVDTTRFEDVDTDALITQARQFING